MPAPKKRTSIGATSAGGPVASNFRPFVEKGRWAAKGTLPLPEPITVPEIFTKVILHGCRKVLFLDPKIRIVAYAVLLFFFSLVSDYLPFPKTYFAYSDNFLNQVFVKFSWGWTFVFTGMFMYLTAATYCCGNRQRLISHMIRLGVATMIWFLWTNLFRIIEESTGQCLIKDGSQLYSIKSRKSCILKSGKWTSFDISGHSFLLIWCVFFMTEEAKAIIGWDGIKDLIRNEEHFRGKSGQPGPSGELPAETSLNALSEEEFMQLKALYGSFDIPAKISLIGMTFLCILWDIMILMTAVYFHVMIEKVIGGLAAIITWIIVYRGIYRFISVGLPGQGLFKYNFESRSPSAAKSSSSPSGLPSAKPKSATNTNTRQRAKEPDDLPKFMGMPLYALKNAKNDASQERLENST